VAEEIQGTGGYGRRGALGSTSPRLYVGAFVVAAVAVCLGGASAIAAVNHGAPATASLMLMAALVACGLMAALGVIVLGGRRRHIRRGRDHSDRGGIRAHGQAARRDRREIRRARRALRRAKSCSPSTMLEEQLSARYGVPVERVAWHVWRIDGQLVEATLDPVTGQLMTGGRELLQ
jgi:hypothetical protein